LIRKILITHSIHRGNPRFKFPIGRGAVRYGFWDSIPEALSSNYDVEYIEISLLKKEDNFNLNDFNVSLSPRELI